MGIYHSRAECAIQLPLTLHELQSESAVKYPVPSTAAILSFKFQNKNLCICYHATAHVLGNLLTWLNVLQGSIHKVNFSVYNFHFINSERKQLQRLMSQQLDGCILPHKLQSWCRPGIMQDVASSCITIAHLRATSWGTPMVRCTRHARSSRYHARCGLILYNHRAFTSNKLRHPDGTPHTRHARSSRYHVRCGLILYNHHTFTSNKLRHPDRTLHTRHARSSQFGQKWNCDYFLIWHISTQCDLGCIIYLLQDHLWTSHSPEMHILFVHYSIETTTDFLSSSGSGMESTQPHEDKWGATWKKSSSFGLENWD
jgi:hypothetical protein